MESKTLCDYMKEMEAILESVAQQFSKAEYDYFASATHQALKRQEWFVADQEEWCNG